MLIFQMLTIDNTWLISVLEILASFEHKVIASEAK